MAGHLDFGVLVVLDGLTARRGALGEGLESRVPVLQILAFLANGIEEESAGSLVGRIVIEQCPHLLDVGMVRGLYGICETPVALRASLFLAEHLVEDLDRRIDFAQKNEHVREVHHVGGLSGCQGVDAREEGFGRLVLTQLIEHGAGQIQHRRVGWFDPSDLPECSLRNGDPTFAGTQARQLCPGSGMVTVQLDDRFECLVCGAALLTLEGHQTDQEMRL